MDHGPWGPSHPQTGAVDELGVGAGEGFNLNLPLPYGTGDAGYERAMREVVAPIVTRYEPDVLIGALGQDASQFDPNGRQALSMDGVSLDRRATPVACRSLLGRPAGIGAGGWLCRHVRRVLPARDLGRRTRRANRDRRPARVSARRWQRRIGGARGGRGCSRRLTGHRAFSVDPRTETGKEPIWTHRNSLRLWTSRWHRSRLAHRIWLLNQHEYADRLRRLQSAMEEANIDTMIVSAPDAHVLAARLSRRAGTRATRRRPGLRFSARWCIVGDDRLLHFDMERHRLLIPRTSVATDLRLSSADHVR